MRLQKLREEVLEANLDLVRAGLVLYTFGNASGIDREAGVIAIKPSGVPYERMKPQDIVLTDLRGYVLEGELNPSSDFKTHAVLYEQFPTVGGIVHTHSLFATAWAQANRGIPALGTTHADYFRGEVPVTRALTDEEIQGDYVLQTGLAICERFRTLDPLAMPAVLVAGHAPFCWGKTPGDAAHNAVLLEHVAQLALHSVCLNPQSDAVSQALLDRHYFRKHGATASYGQGSH